MHPTFGYLHDEIDKGHTQFRFGSVAIYSSRKIVVADTGAGPNGCLIDDMQAKGVERDDVDFVLITHLHAKSGARSPVTPFLEVSGVRK